MTKKVETSGLGEKTGKDWAGWLAFLESIDARTLSHAEIARRIKETKQASGWWAQSITVAYEQHIGRREPGQRADGRFEVSVSRTLSGHMDSVLEHWLSAAAGKQEFDGVSVAETPTQKSTQKWRYWRCALADGSRVLVTIADKADQKAGLTVTHEKLVNSSDKERWRDFWRDFMDRLKD